MVFANPAVVSAGLDLEASFTDLLQGLGLSPGAAHLLWLPLPMLLLPTGFQVTAHARGQWRAALRRGQKAPCRRPYLLLPLLQFTLLKLVPLLHQVFLIGTQKTLIRKS